MAVGAGGPDRPGEPAPGPGPHKRRAPTGGANTNKPETPEAQAEFSALWRNPTFKLAVLEKRYHAKRRTLLRWAKDMGLTDRNAYRALVAKPSNVARSIENVARAVEGSAGGPVEPGVLVPKELNPRENREVAEALAELGDQAHKINGTRDLAGLHRQAIKVLALVTAKSPLHTWTGLGAETESLTRALAMSRKIEAEIPEGKGDPLAVRRDAATAMMRELQEVLSAEDQETLGRIITKGADAMQAKREAEMERGPGGPVTTRPPSAATEPLGRGRPERNAA